jgi:hypothetical protein
MDRYRNRYHGNETISSGSRPVPAVIPLRRMIKPPQDFLRGGPLMVSNYLRIGVFSPRCDYRPTRASGLMSEGVIPIVKVAVESEGTGARTLSATPMRVVCFDGYTRTSRISLKKFRAKDSMVLEKVGAPRGFSDRPALSHDMIFTLIWLTVSKFQTL